MAPSYKCGIPQQWLPKATHPVSSLQDLDLEDLNFVSNINVVDDLAQNQADAHSTKKQTQANLELNGY